MDAPPETPAVVAMIVAGPLAIAVARPVAGSTAATPDADDVQLIAPVLEPPVAVKTTVEPPFERLFPNRSLAESVTVAVAPERTLAADAVTTEVTGDAASGVAVAPKLTAGSVSALASKLCGPTTVPRVAGVCAYPPVSDTTSELATTHPAK